MYTLLSIIHVVVTLFLILVILLQAGKSGGIGGLAGGSASVFGGRGSQTFLEKLTTGCAAIFMITSLALSYISSHSDSMIIQHARAAQEKAAAADQGKPADQNAAPAPAPAAGDQNAAPAPAPTPAPAPAPAGNP